MLTAPLFAAALIGLARPGYVRNRRFFVVAAVLIVCSLIGEAGYGFLNVHMMHLRVANELEPALNLMPAALVFSSVSSVLAGIGLLVAYWPGSREYFEK